MYGKPEERDIALSNLQALPAEPVFGRSGVLTAVATQPDAMLPPRRLASAFERALGLRIGNIINSFDVRIEGLQISTHDALEQRLETLNLLARLSNERERQVTGHDAAQYGLLGSVNLTALSHIVLTVPAPAVDSACRRR